jgi:UDP-glucuronate 4-epimerase
MMFSHSTVLVTGGAGFIGSHVVDQLLERGARVVCMDDFNNYYDPVLKRANAARHLIHRRYRLIEADIRDQNQVAEVLRQAKPDTVIHLAANAGVRPSMEDPFRYQTVNLAGTLNLLEAARASGVKMFVNASSSSVYGENTKVPFEESDALLSPASPYAATKLGAEALVRVYARQFGMRAVSLRFFTVYGPRQRPDMAIAKFTERILQGDPVTLYGDGSARRDFTFIDDIVSGILASCKHEGSDYEVFNLASGRTVTIRHLLDALGSALDLPVQRVYAAPQAGDVPVTVASIDKAKQLLNYTPSIQLEVGLVRYASWLYAQLRPNQARSRVIDGNSLLRFSR